MRGFIRWLMQLICALIGIILVSGLPVLISGIETKQLFLKEYFQSIWRLLTTIFPLSEYKVTVMAGRTVKEVTFFPDLVKYLLYSMELLFLALICAIVMAIIGTFITMMLKEQARQRVKLVFYFLESIPDILVIMLAQLGVILIYKQTGVLVSKIAVIGDERIYWLPVLCLMLLPMIQLYRLSMLTFEAEERKMYVELARSLGFSKLFVLFVHIFRNAIISVFFQSKKTMWFMLSNLFVLELMFNIPGIMYFLSKNLDPALFLMIVISFFIPVYLIYSFGEWYFVRRVSKGGEFG